jgi:exopolyphosphatase/guanosine-5'-triphosphate,3'-diphosphate pyrophosphatase
MISTRYAGIDIGSNAVRLLISDIYPGNTYKEAVIKKRALLRLPVRLGSDVFLTGGVGEQKMKELLRAMTIYSELIDFYKVEKYRACATSATRSSKNKNEIINRIFAEAKIVVEPIDGEEEALLLFETNRYNLPAGSHFLSADLGGGSLQLTLFDRDNLIWTHSYQIGTVRMIHDVVNPAEYKSFIDKMSEISVKYPDLTVIGSGGNIIKISKICSQINVQKENIIQLLARLKEMDIETRMRTFQFGPDRADVIVPAAQIYIDLLDVLNLNSVYVPKTGVADGIIRHLYEKHIDVK